MTERTVLVPSIGLTPARSERQVEVLWCVKHNLQAVAPNGCLLGLQMEAGWCQVRKGLMWKVADDADRR